MPNTAVDHSGDRLQVAVAVILKGSEVCISLRPDHLHKGGCWEFPGGKIEERESLETAVARELQEELGVMPKVVSPLMQIDWDYPERRVRLHVCLVSDISGTPVGREGQQVCWVAIADLHRFEFPEANAAIVERLERWVDEADFSSADLSVPSRCQGLLSGSRG